MTGVVGALVALAVVVALVLVLAVRRADTGTRLDRLRALRGERPRV